MELKIIKPTKKSKLKLTVHKSGKLGFSKDCDRLFNLDVNRFVKFAKDNDENTYLKIFNLPDGETFKISKAGDYYYVNDLELLKDLKVSAIQSVTFDLYPSEDGFFAMLKRFYK
ncbi:hypothetical protein [Chryseobacterium sp. M5A1_1a]